MTWTRTAALALAALAGCTPRSEDGPRPAAPDRPDRVLLRATAAEVQRFDEGDALFETTFRPADGLGPLFIRTSCAACHRDDGRGPGLVGKIAGAGAAYGNTLRPYVTAGATTPITAGAGARVTYRLPPAVFGRGYLEAVDDAEIQRLAEAAARRADIRGRIHRLPDGAIGRFGLKARIATLHEFTADAFQGDMGLTSPVRPDELPNPDGLRDDLRRGVDIPEAMLTAVTDYVRLLELPRRRDGGARGPALFAQALCATCHAPSLRTRADYPIPALAGIDAPVYTDFLLHDMGEALSDGVTDGDAGPREWRTAPLIGLRFQPAYLHDGRARSVDEAISAHGALDSEARASVARYRALSSADRAELLRFVEGL